MKLSTTSLPTSSDMECCSYRRASDRRNAARSWLRNMAWKDGRRTCSRVPRSTVSPTARSQGTFTTIRTSAPVLAERGYVVYMPQNPYIGDFRPINRLANPLGLSLFSFILAQHDRMLDWLSSLPYVDASKIGFYGLSYGGKDRAFASLRCLSVMRSASAPATTTNGSRR